MSKQTDRFWILATENPTMVNTYDSAATLSEADAKRDGPDGFFSEGYKKCTIHTIDDTVALAWIEDLNGACNYADK